MKLSDLMSGAGLSISAEIALVIFLAAVVAIVVRTFAPSRRRAMDEALDDGRTVSGPPER